MFFHSDFLNRNLQVFLFCDFVLKDVLCQIGPADSESANIFSIWIFFSIFFRLLQILDEKIIVKYYKLNCHAIYIFVQRIFLNNMVIFNYFLSVILCFFYSWASASRFFHFEIFENQKKIYKKNPISFFFWNSDSWWSNWSFPIVKLNKFDQSKITSLCCFCDFVPKNGFAIH